MCKSCGAERPGADRFSYPLVKGPYVDIRPATGKARGSDRALTALLREKAEQALGQHRGLLFGDEVSALRNRPALDV